MPLTDSESLERLIRMEAKLDSHLYRTTQAEARLDGHEQRIRIVETGQAKTLGVAAGASAVISMTVAFLHKFIAG